MKLVLTVVLLASLVVLAACSLGSGRPDPGTVYYPGSKTYEDLREAMARPEFERLVLYAALSESAYALDLKTKAWTAPPVTSMEAFCQYSAAPYQPPWLSAVPRSLYVDPPKPKFGWNVGGLGYALYAERLPDGRNRVYLVFRGTDPSQWGDWWSDLRWFTRWIFFLRDEYDQFAALQKTLYERLRGTYGDDYELLPLGHSLGGGLAQWAAYNHPEGVGPAARAVYAFDPSPVTGFFSVESGLRDRNTKGLATYRVYDKGEILAYLRAILRVVFPVSQEDPRITELRFNLLGGNPVEQHSMRALACALWLATDKKEPAPLVQP